jgi:hypothetical protein
VGSELTSRIAAPMISGMGMGMGTGPPDGATILTAI